MTSLVSFLAERQSCCDFKNFQVLLILPTIACGFRLEASGQNWAKKTIHARCNKNGKSFRLNLLYIISRQGDFVQLESSFNSDQLWLSVLKVFRCLRMIFNEADQIILINFSAPWTFFGLRSNDESHSLTFVDSAGQVQGNCRTVDSTGARWCYTSHGSTCQVLTMKLWRSWSSVVI